MYVALSIPVILYSVHEFPPHQHCNTVDISHNLLFLLFQLMWTGRTGGPREPCTSEILTFIVCKWRPCWRQPSSTHYTPTFSPAYANWRPRSFGGRATCFTVGLSLPEWWVLGLNLQNLRKSYFWLYSDVQRLPTRNKLRKLPTNCDSTRTSTD
jgi:hypothetical protein